MMGTYADPAQFQIEVVSHTKKQDKPQLMLGQQTVCHEFGKKGLHMTKLDSLSRANVQLKSQMMVKTICSFVDNSLHAHESLINLPSP